MALNIWTLGASLFAALAADRSPPTIAMAHNSLPQIKRRSNGSFFSYEYNAPLFTGRSGRGWCQTNRDALKSLQTEIEVFVSGSFLNILCRVVEIGRFRLWTSIAQTSTHFCLIFLYSCDSAIKFQFSVIATTL